ncbi:hypothetical protein CCHR01_17151 [Colletotrichum chrysophilum]|uniref:Uncharacterized protein n=1 Tax=Colletotrichum chrysophilum TaxID=1836956 RepID=A0AAD9ECR6_9PEZI|nr:hypothetical protein CCHR01_17151 [Colletotrichum chrysophilum]
MMEADWPPEAQPLAVSADSRTGMMRGRDPVVGCRGGHPSSPFPLSETEGLRGRHLWDSQHGARYGAGLRQCTTRCAECQTAMVLLNAGVTAAALT